MITEKKMKEIRETFDKAEKLLQSDSILKVERDYFETIQQTLGWVLGEYSQNPLEDY